MENTQSGAEEVSVEELASNLSTYKEQLEQVSILFFIHLLDLIFFVLFAERQYLICFFFLLCILILISVAIRVLLKNFPLRVSVLRLEQLNLGCLSTLSS